MTTGRSSRIAMMLTAVGLATAGCVQAHGDTAPAKVASVAVPPDGGPAIVTLNPAAEKRLDVQTAEVKQGQFGLLIPYSAVIYEADGSSWAYVRTEPETYQRSPIAISTITGDEVALTSGPSAGTQVVTVGAAELVGVEIGIDGEE
jgi:hypothetical protein